MLNSRSLEKSIFRIGIFTYKRLFVALFGSVIAVMLSIYWNSMRVIFKTAPQDLMQGPNSDFEYVSFRGKHF